MTNDYSFLEQYIICREDCPLRFIEALAMNGLVKEARVIDCEKKGFKKIEVILVNNSKATSQCRFEPEIIQSMKIINVYIGFSKKNKAFEKIEIVESKTGLDHAK